MINSELRHLAVEARSRAYAPYSQFAVGVALRASDGRIFTGCNVENISFGLTMCAERVALGAALAAGATEFESVVIVSDSAEPVMPCGACRQVLAEFSASMLIVSFTLNGDSQESRLDLLLPSPKQGILH